MRKIVLGVAFLAGSLSAASSDRVYIPATDYLERYRNLLGKAQFKAFLDAMDADATVSSVDTAVPKLPDIFRSNYALVYQSRSLQNDTTPLKNLAGPIRPRVVTSNEDSSMLVAYNSGHTKTGKTIEAIVWNGDDFNYDFYRIRFGGTERIDVETNPAVCKTCHTQNQHPIWGRYNRWVGVVGTPEVTIPFIEKATHSTADKDLAKEEFAYYNRFLATKAQEARYDFLRPKPTSQPGDTLDWTNRSFITNFLIGALSYQLNAMMLANKVAKGELTRDTVTPPDLCITFDFKADCSWSSRGAYHHGYDKRVASEFEELVKILAKPTELEVPVRDRAESYPEFHRISPEISDSLSRVDNIWLADSVRAPKP